MKELKIVMANMPIINGNRGCVALSISSMFMIQEMLKKSEVKFRFYLPDSGYTLNGKQTYDVNGTEIEFYSCGYANWYNLKTFFKQTALLLLKRKEYVENRRVFKNADFIFDIGQGDSFADIYGKQRFEVIDRIHKVARKHNIPYCILPQTIGPFKDEVLKKDALESINQASVVMARDAQSLSFVNENCPKKEVEEYIDVAFFMPFEKQEFSVDKVHIGVNISSLLWHGGYTKSNQFGLKTNYQQLVKNIIEYFLEIPDVQLHLVPHVVHSESNIENDYEVSYHLAQMYKNVILAPLFLSPIYAKNYIAGMDFFMGARMHAAIAAFSSGVPVFPMAYSRKFNGLFEYTLSYPYIGDMVNQDSDTILAKLKQAFEQRETLAYIIKERMQGVVQEKKELLIRDISRFLKICQ